MRKTRIELPQSFFMRVAMGLALQEQDRNARAIEFYELLSSFDFMSSTPTLFNSGTLRSQLSSCYLTTVPDDLDGIYESIKENALLSKFAGGLGNDWTRVRALGSRIKGTNGESQGVVPFLKVVNDTAVAVNQGGKRKGAVCTYLESWHLDIEEFLELRKNTGDDRRRTHDMNTANWIPDLFMKRVMEKGDWTLFSPADTPDLHDLYGEAFEKAYTAYEAKADKGELKLFKRVPAVDLWRKMLSMLFETGHPWITFKDPCNIRSPQQHVGVVHSSNLCTEITLNTSDTETAVCNLGSVNLSRHIKDGQIDHDKLRKTVNTAMRMLDNVIDINYYAVQKAKDSNLRHRPVGMGLMGFQDALYEMRTAYASQGAVEFADESMEAICYYAYWASTELARSAAPTPPSRARCGIRASCPRHPEAAGKGSRRLCGSGPLRQAGLGCPARQDRQGRHAQQQLRGHCAHRHHLQHRGRGCLDRTFVRQPVREVQSVGRIHRHQPVPGARLEAPGPVGRRDGHGSQAFRRLAACHRPRAARDQEPLRHGVRSLARMAGGSRLAPPEVDRPGTEPEYLHGRCLGQEAARHLYAGLAARSEDHLLPAHHQRHQYREVHRAKPCAECRVLRCSCRFGSPCGKPAVSALEAAAAAARAQAPATDIKFCAIDDPGCEACQ